MKMVLYFTGVLFVFPLSQQFDYNWYKAKIWNVGPSGNIKAKARSNSVAFRMSVNGLNPSKPIYIKDFDLYIEKLE